MKATPDKAANITPSDSADLPNIGYVYVGSGGSLRCTLAGMTDGTYIDYAASDDRFYPSLVKRVWSSGTTASDLVLHYD